MELTTKSDTVRAAICREWISSERETLKAKYQTSPTKFQWTENIHSKALTWHIYETTETEFNSLQCNDWWSSGVTSIQSMQHMEQNSINLLDLTRNLCQMNLKTKYSLTMNIS
jgi:hypothetical protein